MRRVALGEDEVLEGDGAVRLAPHPAVGDGSEVHRWSFINTSILFSDTTKKGGLKKDVTFRAFVRPIYRPYSLTSVI